MSELKHDTEVVNQVYKTNNYNTFRFMPGNRPLKPQHLKRLKASFEIRDLEVPIIVNEKCEIVDGQHRYEVLKELEYPISYIVKRGYGLNEVHVLNTTRRNWGIKDFMNSYADLGMEEYIKYREFWKAYRFEHLCCISMLLDRQYRAGQNFYDPFVEGKFKVKNLQKAKDVAEKILMVKEFYPGFRRRTFVMAMMKLLNHPQYDHSEFLMKLRYLRDRLYDAPTVNHYLQLIDEIYNYRRKGKKISFYWELRVPLQNS